MPWRVDLLPRAEAELMSLPADMRARFLHIAEMLVEFGPQRVGMPHVRPLEGGLWEIRMTGPTALRVRSTSRRPASV